MDIILAKDYPSLGFIGDVVKVKRGFARNFLIPRGIGVESSSRNKSALKHKLDSIMSVKRKMKIEAEKRIEDLKNLDISITIKLGASGKSFGSIGAKDIEQALIAKGLEITRKQIILPEIIKTTGEYPVSIRLHSEVTGEVVIKVVADKAPQPSKEKSAGKKTRGRKAKSDNVEDTSSEDTNEALGAEQASE
jgi:large subunit ribosomal protein L9